jgi:transposase
MDIRLLDRLLPKSKIKKNVVSRHSIVNGIMYQLKNGCQWRDLPQDFPKWQTVYSQFRRWRKDGTWEGVLTELEKVERESLKKKRNQVVAFPSKNLLNIYGGADKNPSPFNIMALTITPGLTLSLEFCPTLSLISSAIPISSIIPTTIPKWSRFDTLTSVLVIFTSQLSFGLLFYPLLYERNVGLNNAANKLA